jgi:DNA-binding NarL/FixJ family response regulator
VDPIPRGDRAELPDPGVAATILGTSGAVPAVPKLPDVGGQRKIRILVVEDQSPARETIVRMIDKQADLCCCGQADSVASARNLVAREKPDLVLMDLHLKDGTSLELIETMRDAFPSTKVLVLSQSEDLPSAEKALRTGARGYLLKQAGVEEILVGIRDVLGGRVVVSPVLANRLVYRLINRA